MVVYLNACIECKKAYALIHRAKNIDRIREYDRQRGLLEHRKQKCREYSKLQINRIRKIAYGKAWEARNKHKKSANGKVRTAIKRGILKTMPCIQCGEKAEAHHPDYAKPLDVVWLCSSHHAELHRIERNKIRIAQ